MMIAFTEVEKTQRDPISSVGWSGETFRIENPMLCVLKFMFIGNFRRLEEKLNL